MSNRRQHVSWGGIMGWVSHSAAGPGGLVVGDADTPATATSQPSVLVVDDNDGAAQTFVVLLRARGFDAHYVLTGAEAVAHALTAPPDVVLLDLNLADGDIPGYMVARSLRAKYPDQLIVVMTGWYLLDEDEAEARALGVSDYLFKPVDDEALVASLRAALEARTERTIDPRETMGADGEIADPNEDAPSATPSLDESSGLQLAACEDAFITTWLPGLVRRTQQSFPKVWYDAIVEQVEDTLLEFLGKVKAGIWPVRRSLQGHLHQAAWRNVDDRVRSAVRRREYEAEYAREQPQIAQPERDWSADLETALDLAETETEREAVRRWLLEGDDVQRIAGALSCSQLPVEEQFREVKRFKDRIKKRAARSRAARPCL